MTIEAAIAQTELFCDLSGLGNKLSNPQRLPLGRVVPQADSFLRAALDAHAAAQASASIDFGESVIQRNRRELAILGTNAASGE